MQNHTTEVDIRFPVVFMPCFKLNEDSWMWKMLPHCNKLPWVTVAGYMRTVDYIHDFFIATISPHNSKNMFL